MKQLTNANERSRSVSRGYVIVVTIKPIVVDTAKSAMNTCDPRQKRIVKKEKQWVSVEAVLMSFFVKVFVKNTMNDN